jgi:hypothetical protein
MVSISHDASACSCGVPMPRLLTPARGDGAPLNTKVRVAIATPWYTKPTDRVELRKVDGGGVVPVTEHRVKLGGLEIRELTPRAAFAPNTRYALALVRSDQRPSTWVFGSFRTGAAADRKAPVLSSLGAATAHIGTGNYGSTCDTGDAHAIVRSVVASDPERAQARLLFGVWVGDATGRVDATKPPTGLLELETDASRPNELAIGNGDLCNMSKFPFPARQNVVLGIAAVDEAGNSSALRTVRLRFSQVPTPP